MKSMTLVAVSLALVACGPLALREEAETAGGAVADGGVADDGGVVNNDPVITYTNGVQDNGETGIDCGGSCTPCEALPPNPGPNNTPVTGPTVTAWAMTSGNTVIISWVATGTGVVLDVEVWWGLNGQFSSYNNHGPPNSAVGTYTSPLNDSLLHQFKVKVCFEVGLCPESAVGAFQRGVNPAPPAPLSDQMQPSGSACWNDQQCASKFCSARTCAPIDPSQSPGPGLVSIRCINQSGTCVVRGFNPTFNGLCEQYRDNLGNCAEGRWLYGVEQAREIVRLRSVFCSMPFQNGPLGDLVSFTARSNGDWSSSYAEVVLSDGSKIWQDSLDGHLRTILWQHLCQG